MENLGHKIQYLRTDGGGEYFSAEFIRYLDRKGITRQITAPHSPTSNGVAEWTNRGILDPTRSMLKHAGVPLSFWAEAAAVAVYIKTESYMSRRRSRRSIWVWLFDFVVDAGTSLRMSQSWKECRHLALDVSILERVSVTGPGCIREGCMSCVVISTYVSMSTYVSCAGMSRRTYRSCENCVYKEGCLPCFVFFFSSCNLLYSIQNINLVSVSSVSSVSTVSPYRRRSSSATRLCPTRPSNAVRLSV